jgi:hypothetical protein
MQQTIWREIATHGSQERAACILRAEDMTVEAAGLLVPVYQTTRRYIPKYRNLNADSRKNRTKKEVCTLQGSASNETTQTPKTKAVN